VKDLLLFGVVFFAISVPVVVLARKRQRRHIGRRFLLAAGVGSLFASAVTTTSDALVQKCLDAGNTSCFDGSIGILVLVIGVFAVAAVSTAWVLYKD
jgi:hypothetical protein